MKKHMAHSVRDLDVYQLAFRTAMTVFQISKQFPADERYELTSQIRRSSRSICSNLAEGWRKRRYQAVFINKLTDAGQEATETRTWLEFALACKYIDQELFDTLDDRYDHICAMISSMERKAEKFCTPPKAHQPAQTNSTRTRPSKQSERTLHTLTNAVSGRSTNNKGVNYAQS